MKTTATTNKTEQVKKRFLKELKGAIHDVQKAEAMTTKSFAEAFQIVKKTHGGPRAGAGAKKNMVKKLQRGVKLSEPEYKFIVRKYGSFASGVRSLLPKDLV